MKKSKALAIILIVLFSCNNEHTEKEYYNNSRNLKSEKYFQSKEATTSFLEIHYFEDGVTRDTLRFNELGEKHGSIFQYDREKGVRIWDNYVNGIRSGYTWLTVWDSIFVSQWYRNGKLNGIEKRYDSNSKLTERILWVDDDILAYTKINKGIPGDTLWSTMITYSGKTKTNRILTEHIYIYSFYEQTQNGFINAGDLILNKEGEIFDDKIQNYVIVSIEDTLLKNKPLNIGIKGLFGNLQEGYQLYVKLEISNTDNDEKITKELHSEKGNFNVQKTIDISSTGYNLILGRAILFEEDRVHSTYLFYEDFVVLEN